MRRGLASLIVAALSCVSFGEPPRPEAPPRPPSAPPLPAPRAWEGIQGALQRSRGISPADPLRNLRDQPLDDLSLQTLRPVPEAAPERSLSSDPRLREYQFFLDSGLLAASVDEQALNAAKAERDQRLLAAGTQLDQQLGADPQHRRELIDAHGRLVAEIRSEYQIARRRILGFDAPTTQP